jgi:hypothetical protein
MRVNPIEYHYQLIYGRSANKNLSDARKVEFRSLQTDIGIQILTFDQVVSWYENDLVFKKNVLRVSGLGYEFRSMKAESTNIFAFLGPGQLFLSDQQIADLIAEGYDMESWKRGELLVVNGKAPSSAMGQLFDKALRRRGDA